MRPVPLSSAFVLLPYLSPYFLTPAGWPAALFYPFLAWIYFLQYLLNSPFWNNRKNLQSSPEYRDTLGKLGSSKNSSSFILCCLHLLSVISCPCYLSFPYSLFIAFIPHCHSVQPNILLSHHLNAFPPPFYVNSGLHFVIVREMHV